MYLQYCIVYDLISLFLVFITDIVFFIFLYQRWIYKVDASRVNEFGFSGEMIEEAERLKSSNNSDVPAIEASNSQDNTGDKKND